MASALATVGVGVRRAWWLLPLALSRAEAAERYRLDPAHTLVSFGVRVLGLTWFSAHFASPSGEFVRERAERDSWVEVRIRTDSLVCDNAWWKARLLSTSWFDAQHYPQISFHSDRIRFGADDGATIDGQLKLHGRTRNILLTVSGWNCSERTLAGERCSFDAHARILRSDFGLPHGFWEGGDAIDIVIRGAVKAVTE